MKIDSFFSQFEMFGIKLGLDTMHQMLQLLGNPHETLKFIHVAGTNGKGSVCALVEHALRANGFKTAFYSSPHLEKVNERFRINGNIVDDDSLERAIDQLMISIKTFQSLSGVIPTYFEVTTLLAIILFVEHKCDFVLWETGMGGRFDATNVITPCVSVITSISLDHQSYLGDTLEQIAFEKAGIIKDYIPCISIQQTPEVMHVLSQVAHEKKSLIYFEKSHKESVIVRDALGGIIGQTLHFTEGDVILPLCGKWQLLNVQLAYKVLLFLNGIASFSMRKAIESWSNVCWSGRFEYVQKDLILDGAHNVAAIELLVETFKVYHPFEKATILFANFADKDTFLILEKLQTIAKRFIFTSMVGAKGRKSMQGDALSKMVIVPSESYDSIEIATEKWLGNPGIKLAAGSLYLVGALKKKCKKM